MTMRHEITPPNLLVGYLKTGKLNEKTGEYSTHITDGEGMFIEVNTAMRSGDWMFQYKNPVSGKRTKMKLGECSLAPDNETIVGVGVAAARVLRGEMATLVKNGKDPVATRDAEALRIANEHADKVRREQEERAFHAENARRVKMGDKPLACKDSFRDCAERWIEQNRTRYAATYVYEMEQSLAKHAYPVFGDMHINEVAVSDVAKMQEPMAARGDWHALIKARRFVRKVFAWAMHDKRQLRTLANPVVEEEEGYWDDIPETESRAALTDPKDIRELMLAINAPVPPQSEWDLHGGRFPTPTVMRAIKLAAYVGQRPGNVRKALRAHFDLDAAMPTWTIPAIEMKGRTTQKRKSTAKPHVVYLSTQAVAILREQFASNDKTDPGTIYAFPGQFKAKGKCMGPTAIGDRLNAMGFKGLQHPHGFRTMMRSAGEVFAGCDALVLETMLAHKEAKMLEQEEAAKEQQKRVQKARHGGMPGVYDRTAELLRLQRAKRSQDAAQKWANWLDRVASADWRIEWEYPQDADHPHLALAA